MFRSKLVLASLIAVFLLCSQVQATHHTSHWNICGEGQWEVEGETTNWIPNLTPDNKLDLTFDVVIDPLWFGPMGDCTWIKIGLTGDYTINKLDCYGYDCEIQIESWGWHRLTLNHEDGLTNEGDLEIEEIQIIGDVTNVTGATLELYDMDIEGNLLNQEGATINVDDEVWVDSEHGNGNGDLQNYGTIEISPAGQLGVEGEFDNSGTILIYGGQCGADEQVLENNGVIGGFGVLYGGQEGESVQNDGQIIASGGSLVVACEGTLINTSTGLLRNEPLSSLQIKPHLHDKSPADVNNYNYGRIEVNAGGGVAFDCNMVNESGGTIELLGGTLAAQNITHSAGATLYGFGTITTHELLLETGAEIELTGPTNIICVGVSIANGATLIISAGQTLITGHTTNNGTIVLAGGTVIFQGGYSGSGKVINATPPFARVGHWQMDDDATNTLVEDSSGYDNDGTAQQNTVNMSTAGVVDDALSFNGTSDYVDIGSNPIPSSGDWTLCGWVYCEGTHISTTDDWATAFGSGSWTGSVKGVQLYIKYGNLRVCVGDGSTYQEGTCVATITTTNKQKWYHVVVVYDSTNTQAEVYVDGAYSLTIYQAYAPSNVNFTIGNSLVLHASESYWYGKIDNVSIFNEALAEAEIEEMYKEVVILAGHWRLDDNAATPIVKDSSNRGNDGTAQQNTVNMSTEGVVGDALSFNGIDDYINIGSNPIPSSVDWTLCGWVYCEGALGGTDSWATAFGSGSWTGSVKGVQLYIKYGNLRVCVGDGSTYREGTCVATITTTNKQKWYHVVVVYDSTNTEAKVYVDEAYSLTIDRAYEQSNVNFTIGNSLGLHASESFWYGKIDNVMIFNEALTDSQIQEVYNE